MPVPSSPDAYETTPRSELKRRPTRGRRDRPAVHAILDEGLVAHVAFSIGVQPFAIPMAYVRLDETIYLHGSPASRMLRHLGQGVPVCVTVTLLDGLVLARSAFHHSMNFRSAAVFGKARRIDDLDAKSRVLDALVDHVVPGRAREARAPSKKELQSTRLLAIDIEEASAKVRTGPPLDDEEDLTHPVWAGVIPLTLTAGAPQDDPTQPASRPAPDYATGYRRASIPAPE